MMPTRTEAERLLAEAETCNPSQWADHCRVAAHCAEKIAAACGMDAEKAYILGLLHDIGRKFGVSHMKHISDGYTYMMSLGYEEAAKICLTHSFSVQNIHDYIGRFDIEDDKVRELEQALAAAEYDDYDRLIQLCDSLAGSEGVLDIEERMSDVKRRYGAYPQEKWDMNIKLKVYFEEKAGKEIYEVVEKETYRPS